MSVVMLNVKIPECCGDCDFPCRALSTIDPIGKTRPKECPLRPLPEKHRRLIDAQAFEMFVQEKWEQNEISNGDWMSFREWLRDQETIIEAEGGSDE